MTKSEKAVKASALLAGLDNFSLSCSLANLLGVPHTPYKIFSGGQAVGS